MRISGESPHFSRQQLVKRKFFSYLRRRVGFSLTSARVHVRVREQRNARAVSQVRRIIIDKMNGADVVDDDDDLKQHIIQRRRHLNAHESCTSAGFHADL